MAEVVRSTSGDVKNQGNTVNVLNEMAFEKVKQGTYRWRPERRT